MAACNFTIGFTEPIDGLIEKAKSGISSAGGSFNGNSQKGEYSIPTGFGKITGRYNVKDKTIIFEIESKPFVVTCRRIEDELRKYLEKPTQELFQGQITNLGAIKVNKPVKFENIELLGTTAASSSQLITATVTLYIEDSESWGSNETWRGTKSNSVTLSTVHLPQQFMEFVIGMGGEIRVELYFTAQIINSNGDAIIDAEFKLFEGASESTNDLDGVRTFQILVNNNSQSSYISRVNNDDEGGDFAIANISITNNQITS